MDDQKGDGEKVAVKVMQDSADSAERFQREILLTSILCKHNPSLVQFSGWYLKDESDEVYFILELARIDLLKLIKEKQNNLTLQNKIFILLQVSNALKYLHKSVRIYFFFLKFIKLLK